MEMSQHGVKDAGSSRLISAEDVFGLAWGEELSSPSLEQTMSKNIKSYASFYLEGKKYFLYDTVYLQSASGPPYVGRIASLSENSEGNEKQMLVRWFCRTSELPEGLPGIDYNDVSKEVFMMWGSGAQNIVNPASTIRKCIVLCTAKEKWNTSYPSTKMIEAADHIFDRAFDTKTQKLRRLDVVVNQFGEQTYVASKSNGESQRRLVNSGSKSGASRLIAEQPLPLAVRRISSTTPLNIDLRPVEGQVENIQLVSSPSASQYASDSKTANVERDLQTADKSSDRTSLSKEINLTTKKRPRLEKLDALLLDQTKMALSEAKLVSRRVGEEKPKLRSDNFARGRYKILKVDISSSGTGKSSMYPGSNLERPGSSKRLVTGSDTKSTASEEPKENEFRRADTSKFSKSPGCPVEDHSSVGAQRETVGRPSMQVERGATSDFASHRIVGTGKSRSPQGLGTKLQQTPITEHSKSEHKATISPGIPVQGNSFVVRAQKESAGIPSLRVERGVKGDHASQGSAGRVNSRSPKILETKLPTNLIRGQSKSEHNSTISPGVCVKQNSKFGAQKETMGITSLQVERGAIGHIASDESDGSEKSRSPKVSGDILQKTSRTEQNKSEHNLANRVSPPSSRHRNSAPPCDKDVAEPKTDFFKFSWESSVGSAMRQRKALLLQNLDPWFSSSEIEEMLRELLQITCYVRMLPPKNFACYTSGEALVLFRTQNAAEEALKEFTGNILILSKDERPVIVSMAREPRSKTKIHGFLNVEKFGPIHSNKMERRNAIGTSHCAQANTIEYDLGLQWRLLQDRQTEAWTIAAKEHQIAIETDRLVSESKLRK